MKIHRSVSSVWLVHFAVLGMFVACKSGSLGNVNNDGETPASCSDGPVDSECICNEHVVSDGYCCSGVVQDNACDTFDCGEGLIASECLCQGSVRSEGYCCANAHQSHACGVTVCADGEVSDECMCGDTLVGSGYCCSGTPGATTCDVPVCDDGEVLRACTCGDALVTTGYCCRDSHQTSACSFVVYYVSNSDNNGNDDNLGTSSLSPWKSLDNVNHTLFDPGDTILFKRGDQWVGTVTVTASGTAGNPISYGAYGAGVKPKLYGSEVVTGWTHHADNIYKAPVTSDINQLFVDGERAIFARFPNDSWAYVDVVSNTTTMTSSDLDASTNYIGATWVGRTSAFTRMSKTVTAQDGQQIILNEAPYLFATDDVDAGFILLNKLEFLDEPGEWYYDESARVVYLWLADGESPAGREVRGSYADFGFYLETVDHIEIKDLTILHSANMGIYVNQSDDVRVNNVDIISPAIYGIRSYWYSASSILTNNFVYQANEAGISLVNNPGALIQDNEVVGTGLLRNICRQCEFGQSPGKGISVDIGPMTVAYNKVIDSGYTGIHFNRGAFNIHHNYVNGACLELDDGGGIYTYNGYHPTDPGTAGSIVDNNIVLNVYGNTDGKNSTHLAGYGIYLDNNIHHVTVTDNIVKGANGAVLMNDNGYNDFDGNLFMDATLLLNCSGEHADNTFTNNLFYLTDRLGNHVWWGEGATQRFVYQHNAASGIFNDNTYVAHYTQDDIFVNLDGGFAQWQLTTGQDARSSFDGTPMAAGYTQRLFYNAAKTNKTFDLNAKTFVDVDGNTIATLTLEPFTATILMGDDFAGVEESISTVSLRSPPIYD